MTTGHPGKGGAMLFTLPDGRVVECLNTREAQTIWDELTESGSYTIATEHLRAGDTIIDVGAHAGLTSLYLAAEVPQLRVIALEPAPRTFECLRANFERHLPRSIPLRTAAGPSTGSTTLTYYPNMPAMSSTTVDAEEEWNTLRTVLFNKGVSDQRAYKENWHFGLSSKRDVEVPVTTLSRIIEDHQIAEVGFLKIDAERAELDVLMGIDDDHWQKIQSMAIEVHDIDGRVQRITEILRARQYSIDVCQAAGFIGTDVYMINAAKLANIRHNPQTTG